MYQQGLCPMRSCPARSYCTILITKSKVSYSLLQFTKTVRLPLSLAEPFLKEFQDLKIVYLVRDPRATLHSRKGRDFCVNNPVCMDPERLCGELKGNA